MKSFKEKKGIKSRWQAKSIWSARLKWMKTFNNCKNIHIEWTHQFFLPCSRLKGSIKSLTIPFRSLQKCRFQTRFLLISFYFSALKLFLTARLKTSMWYHCCILTCVHSRSHKKKIKKKSFMFLFNMMHCKCCPPLLSHLSAHSFPISALWAHFMPQSLLSAWNRNLEER